MPRSDGEDDEEDEGPRDRRAGDGPNPKVVNHSGNALMPRGPRTTSARPRYSASVPSVTTSDGRPHASDEEAVEQPAERADDEDDRDRDLDRYAGRVQESEDRAGQAGHRLDRQVDFAGDDDEGHRQGHDRDLDDGRDQVGEVAGGQEDGEDAAPIQTSEDEHDREQDLPARERRRPAGGPMPESSSALIGRASGTRPLEPAKENGVDGDRDEDDEAVDRLKPELRQARRGSGRWR